MKKMKKQINFEPSNDSDVINKTYPNTNPFKKESNISLTEKDYNEAKLRNNKLSEEVSFERALETTIQTLYDKGLFDNYDNANEVSKGYFFVERRRFDLKEMNDVIQCFFPFLQYQTKQHCK